MTEQEFSYFSNRIRSKLTKLANRFNKATGLDVEAEDIVQDALVTLWQLSEKGYPIRDAEALAVKITKTRCVEIYRRRHIRLEPLTDHPVPGGVSATTGTDENDLDTIRNIVQRNLTDSQRDLVAMRNEQEMSLDEIAVATGRPKGSIKVSLSIARKKNDGTMEKDTMTMEDKCIYQIDSYLNDAEVEFDRILAMDGRKNKIVHRSALIAFASAAAVALFFWLDSAMPSSVEQRMTPVQIAEGISQMMLLDIGDIESIEAVPKDTYAILTARMKDGSTCSYIMKCDEVEGTTTLFAHNNN